MARTSASLSVFRRFNDYEGKVLVKATPDWSTSTVLLRMLDQDNVELMITRIQDGKTSCDVMEEGRIYNVRIPGQCVKRNNNVHVQGKVYEDFVWNRGHAEAKGSQQRSDRKRDLQSYNMRQMRHPALSTMQLTPVDCVFMDEDHCAFMHGSYMQPRRLSRRRHRTELRSEVIKKAIIGHVRARSM